MRYSWEVWNFVNGQKWKMNTGLIWGKKTPFGGAFYTNDDVHSLEQILNNV